MCIALVTSVGMSGLAEVTNASEDLLATGFLATWGLVSCLFLLFTGALFFLSPAIVIQYVRTGELSALFRFGEVVSIARENIGDILITALATFTGGLILNLIVGIVVLIPCLGWVAAPVLAMAGYPWLTAITGHLYGQIMVKGSKEAQFA